MQTQYQTFNYRSVLIAAIVLFGTAQGCNSGPELGSLSGTVSSNGTAFSNCRLEIVNKQAQRSIGAFVNDDGTYKFAQLPLGEYRIAVHQKLDPHSPSEPAKDKRIPAKYSSTSTSGFSVSIASAEEVVLNLDLSI